MKKARKLLILLTTKLNLKPGTKILYLDLSAKVTITMIFWLTRESTYIYRLWISDPFRANFHCYCYCLHLLMNKWFSGGPFSLQPTTVSKSLFCTKFEEKKIKESRHVHQWKFTHFPFIPL